MEETKGHSSEVRAGRGLAEKIGSCQKTGRQVIPRCIACAGHIDWCAEPARLARCRRV